ncbi:DUF1559 domain-containing protein, partial [Pirellulales bacterium]|nr:DUF1559 domain-containing protein [Pirellulales bacterium]
VLSYTDAHEKLPHQGTDIGENPNFRSAAGDITPPRPAIAAACSWVYKILPFIEQQNLYTNWNHTTSIPSLIDPSRGGIGLAAGSSSAFDTSTSWNPDDENSFTNAGAVTDYAANIGVIGSGMNTEGDGVRSFWPGNWFKVANAWDTWDLKRITDGTSNTILIGTKAMATQVYGERGGGFFLMDNGARREKLDAPITCSGIWVGPMGAARGWTPDTVNWMAGANADTTPWKGIVPGNTHPIATRHRDWVAGSHIVVQDRPNLDAFNRWGSPYPAGGIFALVDGSVRTISFDGEASLGSDGDRVDAQVLKAFLTPNGGEVAQD